MQNLFRRLQTIRLFFIIFHQKMSYQNSNLLFNLNVNFIEKQYFMRFNKEFTVKQRETDSYQQY